MTEQGHPYSIIKRAIERGNLIVAEATLRTEIPQSSLIDLLELTALIALKDPKRHSRVSARWLQRCLEADQDATIYDGHSPRRRSRRLGGRYHQKAFSVSTGHG